MKFSRVWASGTAEAARARSARVPSVLQFEAVECGAASLAMILARLGCWVPLEELRAACGVTRNGAKASNILRAARKYGLVAKGFKADIDTIDKLPWPLILNWNFHHFLVFEGMDGDSIWLNDPVSGPRKVTRAEFEEAFTGVALAFELGPDFVKKGTPPGTLEMLWSRLETSRPALVFLLLASLALVLPGIVIPAMAQIFVDGVLINDQDFWLLPLLMGMALTAILRGALIWMQQRQLVRLESKLTVVGASAAMWHLLRLPMTFFTHRHPGEITNRVAANGRVARLLSGQLATTAINLISVVFFAAVMLTYDFALGALAIALMLLSLFVARGISKQQEQSSLRQLTEEGKLSAATVGSIQSIETLKASGLESQAFEKITGHQANLMNIRGELGVQGAIVSVLPAMLRGLASAAILGLGAWRVMDGAMTIGTLVAFQSLAESFAGPISRFVSLAGLMQSLRVDLQRIEDAGKNELDPLAADDGRDRGERIQGTLRLEQISFGYNPLEPPFIEGLDLDLTPGMRVALVGSSGSGKSTVGRIVCGLLKPWTGRVLIDGRPIETMSAGERARAISHVDQDIFLFEGSVRDNLTLWDAGVPDHNLVEALSDAAMLDEVAARPAQIDAHIEEAGTNFSGGQRQRLEIARALVADPAILVLDEATAALDPATEKTIDDRLRRRGCSCIIIAHRLSTVRDCDRIVVMREGRVVESGDHDALMRLGGEYAALVASH